MKLKTLLLSLLFVLAVFSMNAQMEKVPKQYTVEAGYIYTFDNGFENSGSNGGHFLLDYAWQLSGFHKKKAAYITVPLGYSWLMGQGAEKDLRILSYGWTVRHELGKDRDFIPFIGYGLLLNQLRQEGTEGSIFGHQTQFEFGFNYTKPERIQPFIKLEYSMIRFPQFGADQSYRMNHLALKFGIRMNSRDANKK
ncbi:hypothetical protein ACE1ET_13055 [Saccharicrinis sp. FJH62]|uniref:hypothetical protein n=1 Tax=Saccharicrinis sp. FJH62 TaxID=3344657 RepID=UPI0035D4EBFA